MYQNVLVRVLHSVVDAHFMDTPSFKVRMIVAVVGCMCFALFIPISYGHNLISVSANG